MRITCTDSSAISNLEALSDRFQALAQAQAPDREVEFAHGRDVVASSWQLEFHQGRGIEVDALPAYCYVKVRSCDATRASPHNELLSPLDSITFLHLDFPNTQVKC